MSRPDLLDTLRHYGVDVVDGRTEQLPRNLRWLIEHVQRPHQDDCVEWPFGRFDTGYGCVKLGAKSRGAHRVVHELATGERPPVVRHRCDNPPCVNPRHLLGGTYWDNTMDAIIRGRMGTGERHWGAKLTWPQVREIRSASGERHADIAARYGVSKSTVAMIRRGEIWKEGPCRSQTSSRP